MADSTIMQEIAKQVDHLPPQLQRLSVKCVKCEVCLAHFTDPSGSPRAETR